MAYIDKARVIGVLNQFKKEHSNLPSVCLKMIDIALNIIKHIPTADVEKVKHGKWKVHPDGSGTCSCCNRTQKAVWDYDNKQNFCGHCGADMRGGKNDL